MKTKRGLSVALALAFVGVAPSAAQQPQYQEGRDHAAMQHEGPPMMVDHGPGAMMAMGTVLNTQVVRPATDAPPRRARRASGPSRIAAAAGRYIAASAGEPVHVERERVRRFSGPSRVPSAIVARHALSPEVVPEAGRRAIRRASGPSRISRG